MIIGNGDIAKVLWEVDDDENVIYFASGVSNSKCEDEAQYQRERDLLSGQPKDKHLVYFSSLALHYNEKTRYARHKTIQEAYINRHFTTYTIFRIGNITWGDNPYTIINYFKQKMAKLEPIEVEEAYRYLLTREELLAACKKINKNGRETIDLSGRMIKISDIVTEIIQGKL
jgi:hypothetical protein